MTKFFYMDHPINTYIKKRLGITVDQFSSFTGYPQSTLASWVSRNRRVESLPISFFDAIAIVANRTIDQTFREFLQLQDEYDRYIHESIIAAKNETSIYMKSSQEAIELLQLYKKSSMIDYLIKPSKQMKKSLKDSDKLAFLEALFEIYSNIGKAVPKWILNELKGNDDFSEIGTSFINGLEAK